MRFTDAGPVITTELLTFQEADGRLLGYIERVHGLYDLEQAIQMVGHVSATLRADVLQGFGGGSGHLLLL